MRSALRPVIYLGLPGDPFTLFYDYDQIENGKLTLLSPAQRALWFRARLRMTHIEPLERIWKDNAVFGKLLHSKLDPNAQCSFSIAAMGLMLTVVEALGSFRNPAISRSKVRDKNWKVFAEFLANHLRAWNVNEPRSNVSVPEVLWKSFRNGITHDLRVDRVGGRQLWGSLEFQGNFANPGNGRFELHGKLLRVCPTAFFDDLKNGTDEYFSQLLPGSDLLVKFGDRFDEIYLAN